MGLISILFFTIPLLFAIGVVIYTIIIVKSNQKKTPLKITSHTLIQFYLNYISCLGNWSWLNI